MKSLKINFKKALKIAAVLLMGFLVLGYFASKEKKEKDLADKNNPKKDTIQTSKLDNNTSTKEGVINYGGNGNVVETKPTETNKTNYIQGIKPVDVYGNFEKIGYTIDKNIGTEGSFFIATFEEKGISYEAKIFCENNVSEVTSIRLSASRLSPQYNSVSDIKPFLKYGCSVPYNGADAAKANAFVDENFNKNKASIIIAGVKFTIYAPTQFVRMIDIEVAK
jgi:hypothetical protein